MNRPNPEKITLADVEKFVSENIVEADDSRLECGDGRYSPSQSKGAVRIFGGDFGPMLAFADVLNKKEIDLDNDNIISASIDALKVDRGEDAKLFFHSDEHHEEDGGIGCGHANQASLPENDGEYGVSFISAKDMFEKALERPEAEKLILKGDHKEKSVLFVYGDEEEQAKYSVNSQDEEGKNMFFVVDIDRIKKHFDNIIPRMSKSLGVDITPDEVFESYKKQMTASAGHLAKGLPVFDVAIDSSGKPSVAQES